MKTIVCFGRLVDFMIRNWRFTLEKDMVHHRTIVHGTPLLPEIEMIVIALHRYRMDDPM
jgi:hypothetical protein